MAFKPTYVLRKCCLPLYNLCVGLSCFFNRTCTKIYMRPGVTKGTLRRENQNSFFGVLCLITFHWSFKKLLSSSIFDKVMVTSMFRN